MIIDVDECTAGTHRCPSQSVCVNNYGNYTCRCQSGYSGNGTFCEGIAIKNYQLFFILF